MLALLLAAALGASPAGFYAAQQPEVGAALELSPDGRFRFQFDYGAVSESGAGRWIEADGAVVLTSDPMPRAPAYRLVEDRLLPRGRLSVTVVEPESPWFDRLDLLVRIDGGGARTLQLDRGEVAELGPGRRASVVALVPVTGEAAGQFDLDLDRGHALLLRFEPNDLNVARFAGTRLPIEDGDLLLTRYDVEVRLVRASEGRD